MMKWIFLASIAVLQSTSAYAEIYKCTLDGVETYSQDPCGDDTQVITVNPPTNMHSGEGAQTLETLVEQCTASLRLSGGFKDPESIQVEGYSLDWLEDDSGARRVIQMNINAKNSYGGYGGVKSYPCFLNYSGTKLSDNQYLIYK
jgi:hypothetical protein